MIHQLKLIDKYFEAVISGKKTFEIRFDDRCFQEGDYLALNEINDVGVYTGRSCVVYVDYILREFPGLLSEGVVCMAIKPCRIIKTQEAYEQNFSVPEGWVKVPVVFRDNANLEIISEVVKAVRKPGYLESEVEDDD